jgi:hypothetical protein
MVFESDLAVVVFFFPYDEMETGFSWIQKLVSPIYSHVAVGLLKDGEMIKYVETGIDFKSNEFQELDKSEPDLLTAQVPVSEAEAMAVFNEVFLMMSDKGTGHFAFAFPALSKNLWCTDCVVEVLTRLGFGRFPKRLTPGRLFNILLIDTDWN